MNSRLGAGYFTNRDGQAECISCDNVLDTYQANASATNCTKCPPNTQRWVGVLDGSKIASCQCRAGARTFHRLSGATRAAMPSSSRADHWRHDGLAGMPCSPCPEGAICEVTISFVVLVAIGLAACCVTSCALTVGRVRPSSPILRRTGGRPPRCATAAASSRSTIPHTTPMLGRPTSSDAVAGTCAI